MLFIPDALYSEEGVYTYTVTATDKVDPTKTASYDI